MIDEPVPTMPEIVPATSPTKRTKRKLKGLFPWIDEDQMLKGMNS
jgi:hypothetical protein